MFSSIQVSTYKHKFYLKNLTILLGLFLLSIASSYLSIYIQPISITLTLESIPLILVGFIFGPVAGAMNAALVDFITFPWGSNYEYSFWFLLQPVLIGSLGGLRFLLKKWSISDCLKLLWGSVIGFTILYSFVFPSEIPVLLLYAFIFSSLGLWARNREDKLLIVLLVIFSLVVYLCSFGVGVIGSMTINKLASPLLFFKVRTIKELTKLAFFLPVVYYSVRDRYEVFK